MFSVIEKSSPTHSDPIFVDDKCLAERYSVSRSTIWRWQASGKIPRPKKITAGTSRWNLAEIIEHLESGK